MLERKKPRRKITDTDLYPLISQQLPSAGETWYIGAVAWIYGEEYFLLMTTYDIYHDSVLVPACKARVRGYRELQCGKAHRTRRLRGFVCARQRQSRIPKRSYTPREKGLRTRHAPGRASKEKRPRYAFDRRKPDQWYDGTSGKRSSEHNPSTALRDEDEQNDGHSNPITGHDSPTRDENESWRAGLTREYDSAFKPGDAGHQAHVWDTSSRDESDLDGRDSDAKSRASESPSSRASPVVSSPVGKNQDARPGERQDGECGSHLLAERNQNVPQETYDVNLFSDSSAPPELIYPNEAKLKEAMRTWRLPHGHKFVSQATQKNVEGSIIKRYYYCSQRRQQANKSRKIERTNCSARLKTFPSDPCNPRGEWQIHHLKPTHTCSADNPAPNSQRRRRAGKRGMEKTMEVSLGIDASAAPVSALLPGELASPTRKLTSSKLHLHYASSQPDIPAIQQHGFSECSGGQQRNMVQTRMTRDTVLDSNSTSSQHSNAPNQSLGFSDTSFFASRSTAPRGVEETSFANELILQLPSPSPDRDTDGQMGRSPDHDLLHLRKDDYEPMTARDVSNEVIPAPSVPATPAFEGAINVDALPDASDPESPDLLFEAARHSLAPDQQTSTEALSCVVKFFNPNHDEWQNAEAISTDESAQAAGTEINFNAKDGVKYITSMVNCEASHWTSGVIHLHDRTIEIYDALHEQRYLRMTREALLRLARGISGARGRDDMPAQDWRCVNCVGPRQADEFNCGIFAAAFVIRRMHGMDVSAEGAPDVYRKIFEYILTTAHPSSTAKGALPPAFLSERATMKRLEAEVTRLLEREYPDVTSAQLKAAYSRLSDGLRRAEENKEECLRIKSMLRIVLKNRVEVQEHLERQRKEIVKVMRLLGQNAGTYQNYATPVPELTVVKSLTSLSSLLDHSVAAYNGRLHALEDRKHEIREKAKAVAMAEIENWPATRFQAVQIQSPQPPPNPPLPAPLKPTPNQQGSNMYSSKSSNTESVEDLESELKGLEERETRLKSRTQKTSRVVGDKPRVEPRVDRCREVMAISAICLPAAAIHRSLNNCMPLQTDAGVCIEAMNRPFHCTFTQCTRRFNYIHQLRRHVRGHTMKRRIADWPCGRNARHQACTLVAPRGYLDSRSVEEVRRDAQA